MPARRNTLQPIADTWDAFYCRLSRDDDNDGDSNSIQHQKLLLQRYVREQGWNELDVYIDDDYSGTNFQRPGVQRLIADAKAGRINVMAFSLSKASLSV